MFLDGDTVGYSEVITDTGWRGHIMHQAFTRAHTKLSFAFGLGHLMAQTTGTIRFDHIQEKLGELWIMGELARSAVVAAEAGASSTRAASCVPTSGRSSRCGGRCRNGSRARTRSSS